LKFKTLVLAANGAAKILCYNKVNNLADSIYTMRDVYTRSSLQGFQSPSSSASAGGGKVECVAASDNGRQVFIGTSEGAILKYNCTYQQGQGGAGESYIMQFAIYFLHLCI
jgi:hypothetical protein